MKYFKTFETHSDYESYINGGGVVYPNVSVCEDDKDYDLHINDIGTIGTYVEIAGTKWSTKNIGALTITDYGKYFAWGDISGYTPDQVGSGEGQKYFAWADYKYNDGTADPTAENMTKYNETDGLRVLELSDDSAFAAWGGKWRIPTREQFAALGTATTSAYTNNYMGSGVKGIVLTDKTDSSKKLFFPAAGFAREGTMNQVNNYGYYRGRTLSSRILNPYDLYFTTSYTVWGNDGSYRRTGFTIRPVLDE